MKKKKLKKEIKELRKDIAHHREMISNLGDKYVELRTDLTKLKIRDNFQTALNFDFSDRKEKETENGNT